MISVEDARAILAYDPVSGLLRWTTTFSNHRAGDIAGKPCVQGYLQVAIHRRTYPLHRVCWLIHFGKWPENIDHIDGDRANNCLLNLRNVDQKTNNQNIRSPNRRSKTGVLGVIQRRGKFVASLSVEGKRRHLGTFPTAEKAHEVYLEAKRKHHAGCTI